MTTRFPARSAADTGRAIVDLVRSNGVISRVELAEQSGLAAPSVSRIVKRLLDDGLLIEVGQSDPTGGKPRTLLELNTRGRYAIGVGVDDAQLTYVLSNLRGEVVGEMVSAGMGDAQPRVVVHRMAGETARLLQQHHVDSADVTGIGVAIAGRLDERGIAMRALRETSDWEQFALAPALGEAIDLPVTLEHDYVCAALGEFWVGRVPVTSNLLCIYAANGFGAGIFLEGEVYRGSSGNAGEIGHLVLDVDGPDCWCGSRGCLEAFAGPRTVVQHALAMPAVARRLGLTRRADHVRADFGVITTAAVGGDPDCLHLVEESARYLAAAVLSLTNVLDVDRVVLSGPAFDQVGDIYLTAVRRSVNQLSFLRQIHPISVELSQLKQQSAAIGAATVALDRNLTRTVTARLGPAPRRGRAEALQSSAVRNSAQRAEAGVTGSV